MKHTNKRKKRKKKTLALRRLKLIQKTVTCINTVKINNFTVSL